MSFEKYVTYREIESQTEAWVQALDVTDGVSLPNAGDQELTGGAVRAVPDGELLLNSQPILTNQKTLLVPISRSGSTTETVKAVEKFRADKRGEVIVIRNYDEILSPLADMSIVISKGQEESVAQTRSFASMFVAVSAFCARMAGRA